MSNLNEMDKSSEFFVEMSDRQRKVFGVGIMMTIAVVMFPFNILGPMLPSMVEDFGGGMELSGLLYAFGTFGSALAAPIAGRLCSKYGAKRIFMIGLALSSLFTALMGFSPSMEFAIVTRFISGFFLVFGLTIGLVLIGYIFPAKQRVRWIGYYGAVSGLMNVMGPMVAGITSDTIGWQWTCFAVVPFTFIAWAMIYKLPQYKSSSSDVKFDVSGAILFSLAMVAFMSLMQFGGILFSWISWQTGLLLVATVALIIIFISHENRKGESALLPIKVLTMPVLGVSLISLFFMQMTMMGYVLYLPSQLQLVLGMSAAASALPFMLNSMIVIPGGVAFGIIISKLGTKAMKPSALMMAAAAVILNVSLLFIVQPGDTYFVMINAFMLVFGGFIQVVVLSLFHMLVQTTLSSKLYSLATPSITMTEFCGITVGATLAGALFNLNADLAISIPYTYVMGAIAAAVSFTIIAVFLKISKQATE
jgi:MFS family permease